MIYGFVQQSGGHVLLRSEPGMGLEVTLHLPRHLGGIDSTVTRDVGALPPMTHRDAAVLVVEDEPAVRMIIQDSLTEQGYAVHMAVDGRAGLQILESATRIDLLVADIGLPGGISGRALADAARQRRPSLKVLFITGFAEQGAVGDYPIDPGMEIITKPFAIDALAVRIQAMVGG